jgi:hypothetical protein
VQLITNIIKISKFEICIKQCLQLQIFVAKNPNDSALGLISEETQFCVESPKEPR